MREAPLSDARPDHVSAAVERPVCCDERYSSQRESLELLSSRHEVNSVIYNSGSVPDESIFSPLETSLSSNASVGRHSPAGETRESAYHA